MISPSASHVLALADLSGWQTCVEKTREERGANGQFFTPPAIARCLAGWFQPEGFNRPSLHLLDPGAGGGVLTAAVVDRITTLHASGALPHLEEITLEIWELDQSFLSALRRNLSACVSLLRQVGIRATVQLNHGSYIEGAARALDPGLFGTAQTPRITHAILNPPYRKIGTRSRGRTLLASVGIEISNLYAAFVWLAVRQLADGRSPLPTQRFHSAIAWETEVWIADEPDHMIHYNGERFLGPYPA